MRRLLTILLLFPLLSFGQAWHHGYMYIHPHGDTATLDSTAGGLFIGGRVYFGSYATGDTTLFYGSDGQGKLVLRRVQGGGGGSVFTVFGRAGNVVAQGGDYNYTQITGAAIAVSDSCNNVRSIAIKYSDTPSIIYTSYDVDTAKSRLHSQIPTDNSQLSNGAGYITHNQTITLSGDVTGSGATSIATTLATVNSNIGNFGDPAHVSTVTVNAKGLVTAAGNVAISIPYTSVTGTPDLTGYALKNTSVTINGTTHDLSANSSYSVGTVTSVGLLAGTGVSIAGSSPITGAGTFTVTNTAPDQIVTLNAGTGVSVTGTYPNFTITNASPSSGGTVTSIATTDPISGGTITSTGTLGYNYGYSGTYTSLQTYSVGIAVPSISATPSTPTTGVKLYSNSSNYANLLFNNGKVLGLNGSSLTASRVITSTDHDFTFDNITTATTTTGTGFPYGNGSAISFKSTIDDAYITSAANWNTAYTNRITSLTTTGASGAATLSSNTLNVPNYTLAGLGGISLTSLSGTAPISYNSSTGAFSLNTVSVSFGGTGLTTLTAHNLLVGNGTGNVSFLAPGSTANKLVLSNGTDFALSTPTYPNSAPAAGDIIQGDGTNYVNVTPPTAPTASRVIAEDGNKNFSTNNVIEGYQSIATAATTTTLTVSSPYQTYFTGSTTQTCKLPVTSTLTTPGSLAQQFQVVNLSTGTVTVQSSGGTAMQAMAQNTILVATAIGTGHTDLTDWSYTYSPLTSVGGGGGTVTSVLGGFGVTATGTTTVTVAIGVASTFTMTESVNMRFDSSKMSTTVTLAHTSDTITLPVSMNIGAEYQLLVRQDATGNRALFWKSAGSAVDCGGKFGTQPPIDTSINGRTLYTIIPFSDSYVVKVVGGLGYDGIIPIAFLLFVFLFSSKRKGSLIVLLLAAPYVHAQDESIPWEAQKFIAAENRAGYTMNLYQVTGIQRFVIHEKGGCNDNGTVYGDIWGKQIAVYPVIGNTATSQAFNLVAPATATGTPSYYLTFTGTITRVNGGMTSNGTTGFASISLPENGVGSVTNFHVTFYSGTNSAAAGSDFGSTGSPFYKLSIKNASNNSAVAIAASSVLADFAFAQSGQSTTIGSWTVTKSVPSKFNMFANSTAYTGNPYGNQTDGTPSSQTFGWMNGPNGISTKKMEYGDIGIYLDTPSVVTDHKAIADLMLFTR